MANIPTLVLDPLSSQKIHQIDQKGNLSPIRFTLNPTYFTLKIEKLEYSSPPTPFSPNPLSPSTVSPYPTFLPTLFSPKLPKTPTTPGQSNRRSIRRIFSFSSRSRTSSYASSSGYSSLLSPEIVSSENVLLSEVQELRVYDYDSKTCSGLINSQSWKGLKPLIGGSRKNFTNKYKVFEMLYGKEFNLKHYKFLVVSTVDITREQQRSELENWKGQIEDLICKVKNLGYFEKLDLWYNKQFEMTTEKCTDNHRLKIWKQFLHRIHHQVSTESLRIDYDYLQRLLIQDAPNFCSGPLGKEEFSVVSRYFVHSANTTSKIFEIYTPGYAGNEQLLELLETASDQELADHPVLTKFQSLFNNYFAYIQNYNGNFPEIRGEMDGASMLTKSVIRRFAERFQRQYENQLIAEKWLCSYYILDYMYSNENTIWCPSTTEVYQPMNHPLSHYYIASSHNTYLTGDQYASTSSVEAYVRCLRQGCRCIEIDVWDGPKNKPTVKHGRTLTTEVKLKDVLNTVRKHAFDTTPYPLIISIENHCNFKQQKVMAKYFRGIFGKRLVTCQANELEAGKHLPSPDELQNRVILKGRKLPTNIFNKNDGLNGEANDNEGHVHVHGGDQVVSRKSSSSDGIPSEDNPCDCLITGELYKRNDTGKWVPCIFVLTNRKLFFIEKRDENDDIGKGRLPNYLRHRDLVLRPSVSSWESNQDLHNDQMWFHGKMAGGRQAATVLLEQCGINGAFLVRESDTTLNGYTLCFYFKDPDAPQNDQSSPVIHCHIHTKMTREHEQMYFLRQNPTEAEMFPSIFELIEHYKQNPLVTTRCRLERLGNAVPHSISHEACEWFYKDMDKNGAEKVLEKLPINGAFLGRYRTDFPGEIVISFQFQNVIKHCHINREGRYLTVSTMQFPKLENLVEHYSKNVFYKDMKLDHPVHKELYAQSQQSDCVQRVYKSPEYLNATVKTVKGRVRAIQSYTSSDPELLSFKKGDIIVNVIKEPDGWWWGTLKDAVGEEALISKQFCSSFVEDVEELDCPFEDCTGKGTYPLGTGAKVKPCTDKNGKLNGIKHYISFKDRDGTKRILGASCSKRKANEWVEMINHVVAKDEDEKKEHAKWLATQKYNIAAEFSDLIYLQAKDKVNVEEIDWDYKKIKGNSIKSLEEVAGGRLFRSNPSFFVWYHMYGLTRVYPKGFRFDSSNYDPVKYWNFGCQMPSLNYQTPDKAMQLNRGKFRENGNCGYVLKPNFMLPCNQDSSLPFQFDPTRLTQDEFTNETCITIQIISARHLEKNGSGQITPIVEVEVVGIDVDRDKFKTSVQDTGLNPYWNETFNLKVRCPQLALIQFSVCDVNAFGEKVLLGESTIPVICYKFHAREKDIVAFSSTMHSVHHYFQRFSFTYKRIFKNPFLRDDDIFYVKIPNITLYHQLKQ